MMRWFVGIVVWWLRLHQFVVWCFPVLFVSRLNPDYNNVLCVGGGGVIISCLAPPIVNNFTLKKWGEVGVVYSGTRILMKG